MQMSTSSSHGMSSAFTASTRVTLWITDWTTTSTATYILTILFVILLGILNRFLSALKSQLEWRWSEQRNIGNMTIYPEDSEKIYDHKIQRHTRNWNRALRSESVKSNPTEEQEKEPLSPASHPQHSVEHDRESQGLKRQKFWIADSAWSIRKHGTLAILEFSRALLGYILMLAVMTYNIGILFAVTGSVLLGELIFARYTRGPTVLGEDGCHS